MSVAQQVYKTERIVLIQARRALDSANPDTTHPDVDDRGYATPEFGPVTSVTKDKTVTVRLRRKKLDDSAPLTIVSSDSTICSIADPASGNLPNTTDMDIQITGVDGGTDKREAILQVQAGRIIIFQLRVWVYKSIDVDVTPHAVTINGGGGTGGAPVANIAAVMAFVQAIWGHYGINVIVHPTRNNTVNFATANGVDMSPLDASGEVATLLNTDHQTNTINAFFVRQILKAGASTGTLGLGFGKFFATQFHMPKTGVILADGGRSAADIVHWGNDLAHEIGHFFDLQHIENGQTDIGAPTHADTSLEDSWSRRMLMHNWNHMLSQAVFPSSTNQKFRPRFDDVGYTNLHRGCMVTLKHLSTRTTDGEVTSARDKVLHTNIYELP
jgi:hypothetical protein